MTNAEFYKTPGSLQVAYDNFCKGSIRKEIADNAPPVNYCGELHKTQVSIYGALRGIRDDFKGVVALFRSIQDFDSRLMDVAKFSLPEELNFEDVDKGVLNSEATDEGFAKALHEATRQTANIRRMGVYLSIAKALTDAIDSLVRKEAKLTERMRLQRNDSPEWRTACDRRVKVRDSISVLTNRRKRVAGLFFGVRDRIARELLSGTRELQKLFTDKDGAVDSGYVAEMLSKNTETTFTKLADIGRSAKESGFAKSAKRNRGYKA